MSRMKHLLRKLHIRGGVDEQHRFGESRPSNNSSPPSSSSSSSTSLSVPLVSSSTPSSFSRNGVVDATERASGAVPAAASSDSSVDFSFFEDEFQVQLALAISASDPDAREDPEAVQIKAAKRMSLGCPSSVAADETLLEFLSLRYWNYNFVNYDERVMDGFYDVYGITSNSDMEGKMPLLVDLQATSTSENVDYEVILVNRSADPALRQLERRAVFIASECQTADLGPILSGLVQKIAELVVGCMGGPVGDADEMLKRWTFRSYELRNSLNTNILPLGLLDVGLSCHRALLFKVLADQINLPCRLVKGSYYTGTDDGAVNLIKVDYDSEYIIDLMGAPGTLIPAEIPNNCLQNSGVVARSSVNIAQNVEGSCFALGKLHCPFENRTSETTVFGHLDHVSQDSFLGSDEACDIDIQAKKDDANISENNQTERFEYEFGKLLLSLHKPHESSSGTGGKASPVQKVKLKDVSEYVISAAQDPEFAQKLHAVLLESGASPPPDLFSDLNPQVLEEHTFLGQNQFVDDKIDDAGQFFHDKFCFSIDQITEDKQQTSTGAMIRKKKENASDSSNLRDEKPILNSKVTNKTGFASLDLHCVGKTIISHGVCSPSVASGEEFMMVNNGGNEMAHDDSTVVGLLPVLSSSLVRTACEEKFLDYSEPFAVGYYQKQLENVFAGGEVSSQGNAGRIVNNVETGRNNYLEEHQLSAKGLIEPANNNPHFVSFQSEKIKPMVDEVAEWEIPWEDFQIGERIGLGSYGEVYRADWHGTEVAVKKFLDQDFSGDALEQFRCEVRIMLRLRHPNVVLFMGAVTRPPNLSILTEFLPRGSLYGLLHRSNVQLDEKRRLRMALDVAKGMNCLHTSHPTIVHRDLKSPNLLVDKNWVVKVCDFGLSRLKHHTFLSSKSTAGTPEWMAPEVLRNEPANEKCDVFSFGVILWELATLRTPWNWMNPMQVVGAVGFQNRRLDIPEEVDPTVAQIISDCWQSDPNLRPSFAQLMYRLKHLQHLAEKT
ncbi:hypothetical protein NE237_024559 [Protea cynaroides]|uniref:non-specific serine/threonine protein kinase n=1 Tax=Protea cynaroides TaxID=273540 RepID=A0A9Q0H0U0_9MAGN|nr:hypothetical protein NE237_024559 [Protea cynaroides]